jgi:hypothetical protein
MRGKSGRRIVVIGNDRRQMMLSGGETTDLHISALVNANTYK